MVSLAQRPLFDEFTINQPPVPANSDSIVDCRECLDVNPEL